MKKHKSIRHVMRFETLLWEQMRSYWESHLEIEGGIEQVYNIIKELRRYNDQA